LQLNLSAISQDDCLGHLSHLRTSKIDVTDNTCNSSLTPLVSRYFLKILLIISSVSYLHAPSFKMSTAISVAAVYPQLFE